MNLNQDVNLVKRIVIKIVNNLRIGNLNSLNNKLKIDEKYNRILNEIIDNFSIPIISNNIMQTLLKIGYRISTNDRNIIDKLLLYRIALITMDELLANEKSKDAIKKDNNDNTNLKDMTKIDELNYRAALYFTALDLIPDFYYNRLSSLIDKLYKRKNDDYLFILGALILLKNINFILQINKLSLQKLFSSRISYINATLITGLLTKYGLIIQVNQAKILNILNRLNKLDVNTNDFTDVLLNKFMPNFKNTIAGYQNISRTFGVI